MAETPPPREFLHKLVWIWENLSHCHLASLGLAIACVLLIGVWPKLISWGALQRLDQRITRDEHALWSELWTLHRGQESPRPKRYLGIQHWIPEESAMSRLKPVSTLPTPDGRA